jgi:hypothetical protein
MISAEKLEHDLSMFSGTAQWYRHWTRRLLYTDGIDYLIKKADAAWLVDAIASYQQEDKVKNCPAQFWELKVNLDDKTAVMTMQEDSGMPIVVKQEIHYTDFPLEHQRLWLFINKDEEGKDQRVLILPSEY